VIFRQKNLLHAFGTSQGDTTMYQTPQTAAPVESDLVGICVRNRLTRRELQVVGFIARAYKNKQIA